MYAPNRERAVILQYRLTIPIRWVSGGPTPTRLGWVSLSNPMTHPGSGGSRSGGSPLYGDLRRLDSMNHHRYSEVTLEV